MLSAAVASQPIRLTEGRFLLSLLVKDKGGADTFISNFLSSSSMGSCSNFSIFQSRMQFLPASLSSHDTTMLYRSDMLYFLGSIVVLCFLVRHEMVKLN